MDVYFQLDGILFVWREDKAALNLVKHGVRFEIAAEIFLDPMLAYADASVDDETRTAAIGRTSNGGCSSPSISSASMVASG